MIWRVLLRVTLTFFTLVVLTRFAGKKQLSQATFMDFVTAIAVGDIAGEKLSDPQHPLLPWLLGTTLWFALAFAMDVLVVKNRVLGKLIEGEPTVLIENGRILEKNLFKNFLRVDDLMALLREKGFFNPSEVEYAIFETDGTLSVLPRSQYRPVQPRDLQLSTEYEGVPREVLIEGRPVPSNLKELGLDEAWLAGELAKQGHPHLDEIFFASIDTQGKLWIDPYKDPAGGPRVVIEEKGPH